MSIQYQRFKCQVKMGAENSYLILKIKTFDLCLKFDIRILKFMPHIIYSKSFAYDPILNIKFISV